MQNSGSLSFKGLLYGMFVSHLFIHFLSASTYNVNMTVTVNRPSLQYFTEIPQFQSHQLVSWFDEDTLLFSICGLPGKASPTLEIIVSEYTSTTKIKQVTLELMQIFSLNLEAISGLFSLLATNSHKTWKSYISN